MMAQDVAKAKAEVEGLVQQLFQRVEQGARDGTAAHVVEEHLFRRLLEMGRQVYGYFLALQGTGDVGEQFTLPDGRHVQRLAELHARALLTIFGEFPLERTVYGLREGQEIEAVPLDARLQLPDSKFSHLLQNWDQLVTTEQPYGQVSRILEMILGVSQHVDSLERMSRKMAATAEEFSWSQPTPPAAEEVVSRSEKAVARRSSPTPATPTQTDLCTAGRRPRLTQRCTGQRSGGNVWLAGSTSPLAVGAPPQADRRDLPHGRPRVVVGNEGNLPAGPEDGGNSRPVARDPSVIHSLRSLATRRRLASASRQAIAVICNYFTKNRERMRYDKYLRKGYPIASGVIEGACRHVIKDRLERTGMSWTRRGAQALLHLRAIATSDQWEAYLTYRIQHENQRLYPYRQHLLPLEFPLAA
jgi:hypothetical protein